jgi:predicted  nucleic acid-binding Zn-ribbon protein
MAWACDRCGTLHTQNPAECRSCGHQIFEPVSDAELQRRSEDTEQPETVDDSSVQTMGTITEPDHDSSPDVAVDGSIADDNKQTESTTSVRTSSDGAFRSVYHTIRAVLLAPLGLLKRYFIPLIAFALVFGLVIYLAL